jgi:hypothetical protein
VTRVERARPVVLVWLLLVAISGSLLLRAALRPPPGRVFVGTFYYVDDFYNYLSYVQQAEAGALVFRNKLVPPTQPPALVNLEWLSVGWLSALLGGRPLVAYRLVGFAVLIAYVALVDRWLRRGGLPPKRRTAALLLVFTGGGLGGLLVATGWIGDLWPYDMGSGLFPFVQTIANPHFVVGTTLLLAGLGAFAADRPGRAVLLGTALGLVRPYDAALLAGVQGLAVLVRSPPREWPRRLAPVAGLAPVLAYNAWVFLWSPGFRVFSSPRYAAILPSPLELALALGPAALVALTALRLREPGDDVARRHRLYLALWATVAVLVIALRPVSFSLQFLGGVGVPLLTLGAIGLSRLRKGVLEAAVPLFIGTALVVSLLQSVPKSYGSVPADEWRVAAALRSVCRTGELVLAPPDIGLFVGGLTPCWPYVSHSASPEYDSRDAATRRFYSAPPADRAAFLEEDCINHVVVPRGWWNGGLPLTAPYRPRLKVDGPGGGLAVYSRSADTRCRPRSP